MAREKIALPMAVVRKVSIPISPWKSQRRNCGTSSRAISALKTTPAKTRRDMPTCHLRVIWDLMAPGYGRKSPIAMVARPNANEFGSVREA